MGQRGLVAAMLLGACGGATAPARAPQAPEPTFATKVAAPETLPERIAFDFEHAVLESKAAFESLFDFDAVGEYEILLHRYDVYGRVPLSPKARAALAAEDGTPYPAARERRNVGNFYPRWVKRTVGAGGCAIGTPRGDYAQKLADIEPLREGTPPAYALLYTHAKAWVAAGGLVRVSCTGGTGGVALVWTRADNERGYNLITIYDD